MSPEGLVGDGAQLALAGVYVFASLSKARNPREFGTMLSKLGVASPLATPAGVAVIATELSVGIGLLVAPSSLQPRLGTVALATLFALAGVWALIHHQKVLCNCFGTGSPALLGWKQIGLLPIWLCLTYLAGWNTLEWHGSTATMILAIAIIVGTVPGVRRQNRLWHDLQSERITLVLPTGAPLTSIPSGGTA